MIYALRSIIVLVPLALFVSGCEKVPEASRAVAGLSALSPPDTSQLDAAVSERLQAAWQEFQQAKDLQGAELAEAYGRLGMVYQANHLLAEAGSCYQNALQLSPLDVRWRYYNAYLLEESGATRGAAQAYQGVLDLAPDYLPARLRRASVLFKLGENQAARDAFTGALNDDPANATAIAGLASIALAEEDFEAAARQFKAALGLQPAANRLYHPLGLALRGLGDRQAAGEAFARRGAADTVYPDPMLAQLNGLSGSTQARLSRALQAANDGRYDLAAQAYADAVALDPTHHLARAGLAQALERLGKYAEAREQVNRVLELAPDYALARLQKGRLLERAGDDQGAVAEYRLALASDAAYTEARFLLANALLRLGEAAEAASEYALVTKDQPDSVLAHYRLGLAHMAAGQCVEAARSLQGASDLNAAYGPVVQALVRNLATCPALGAQQKQQAVADGRWLYQQLPSVEHGETLAMALAANGASDQAVELQRKVLSEASGRADAPIVQFMQENLQRYTRQQPAERPWPAGAAVYLPARAGERESRTP